MTFVRTHPTALLLLLFGAALFVMGMVLTGGDASIQASGVQDVHGGELAGGGGGAADGGDVTATAAGGGLPFTGFGVLALAGLAAVLVTAGSLLRRARV